jgi:hypothetical protein
VKNYIFSVLLLDYRYQCRSRVGSVVACAESTITRSKKSSECRSRHSRRLHSCCSLGAGSSPNPHAKAQRSSLNNTSVFCEAQVLSQTCHQRVRPVRGSCQRVRPVIRLVTHRFKTSDSVLETRSACAGIACVCNYPLTTDSSE